MNSAYRQAEIIVRGQYAGTLAETDEGYLFRYDADYLSSNVPLAVSLTLPLTQEEYSSPTLFPFFDGLILEGLDVACRNWEARPKRQVWPSSGLLPRLHRRCIW